MAKNETTATDIAPTTQVTEAEAAKFELDPHLISLMWSEPFFSRILRKVTKTKTDTIPTAGVLAKDGQLQMWWNPRFVASLTPAQIKGLFKHECYHLVFEHTTTRRHDPHIIWNYATDLAINSLIPEEELPEGGLVPGKAFRTLTEEQKAKMGTEAVGRYEKVSAKIESLPREMAAEWYFGQLQDVADELEQGGQGGCGGECDGSCQPGEGGGEAGSGECNCPGMPGPMDDHEGWDELTDEERELVRGKVKQALEEAVHEADRSGQWGSIPGGMRGKLREMISKEIPWQSVLKQFCGMTRRANRSNNVKRLNRKYPGIHPGVQKGYTSSIAVYIDQSGSVDDASLELFFGELRSLARHTKITLFNFDTEVDTDSEREWDRSRTPAAERTRCGGTDFEAPTKHANKNTARFDGYLILTDGECSEPGKSRLKRGYVICPGRELYFKAPKRDFVIQMTQKKDTV
jgi:predicted metal-dependent peptidase